MDSPPSGAGFKQESPEATCPRCGGPSRRKGTRVVAQMGLDRAGAVVRLVEVVRVRFECRNPDCPLRGWTVYEAGGYPHLTFRPAVAAAAMAELAMAPGATRASVARHYQCDRRTVGRWERWTAGLANPEDLGRLCLRIDPAGLPPPRPCSGLGPLAQAGFLVLLLEHLAQLLRDRGVPLAAGPGLAAILRHQFDRFRTVAHLTRASPPLRVEPAWAPG